MAKGGDKRRVEQNKKTLAVLSTAILVAEALHIVVRLLVFYTSTRLKHYVGLAVISGIYYVCYRALSQLAAPTYGAGGEIIDGGADLGQAGFTAYYFDAIYIGIAVQLGSILSDWFWLLFLAVPAYGLVKLWGLVIQPWLSAVRTPQEQPETEEERRRRDRAEKRAQRRRVR